MEARSLREAAAPGEVVQARGPRDLGSGWGWKFRLFAVEGVNPKPYNP